MSGRFPNPRTQLDYAGPIEHLRRKRGMTREALAEASGVSPSYLSEVERGFKRPSTDVLAAIARALGMASSELLAYVESLSPASPPPRGAMPAAAPMLSPSARRPRPAEVDDVSFLVAPTPRPEEGRPSGDLDALLSVAKQLDPEDVKALVALARRLASRRT
jgi:transcriptional regulator with XRE-family HTH domain